MVHVVVHKGGIASVNITQIRYVLEIARSSSMREAAQHLYLSQPALTASIADLEEEIGIRIFERSNKGVRLTEEGREFVAYGKKAVSQYEVLEDRFLGAHRSKEHFSVSSQHYNFSVDAFTSVVNRYNPDKYIFSFHETRTGEVLVNVRDMKSEIGIISYSVENEAVIKKIYKTYDLEFVPLMKRDAYIYVWENHPLAHEKEISIQQMKDYPCISFEQGEENEFYLHEEALANMDFDKVIKSDDRATSMEIIAKTNGYSIGSGMLAGDGVTLKGLISIKLKEEDVLTIGYIYRRNTKLSEYAKSYVEELEQYREL